jgi:hypothetical protein
MPGAARRRTAARAMPLPGRRARGVASGRVRQRVRGPAHGIDELELGVCHEADRLAVRRPAGAAVRPRSPGSAPPPWNPSGAATGAAVHPRSPRTPAGCRPETPQTSSGRRSVASRSRRGAPGADRTAARSAARAPTRRQPGRRPAASSVPPRRGEAVTALRPRLQLPPARCAHLPCLEDVVWDPSADSAEGACGPMAQWRAGAASRDPS